MISCYDNTDESFKCQLKKIKCLFADKIYSNYNEIRYGVKSCKNLYSVLQLTDLKDLMEYIDTMDLTGFSRNTYRNSLINNCQLLEMATDGCIPDFAVETLKVCNISTLIEKINSL